MVHELKILPEYFIESFRNNKPFELRKDDRDYKVGDGLSLLEFKDGGFTGNKLYFTITYILRDCPEYGLKEGYVILGIR